MKELSERDKAILVDGIPESYLALYCPGLQGHGATLIDRSANANNGTITNATWYRLPSGLWVLSFDGTDAVVDFGKPTVLNNLGRVDPYTLAIEAWVKPTTSGENTGGRVMDKSKIIMAMSGTVTMNFQVVQTTSKIASKTITLGVWNHVAGVYDGANALLYTDPTLTTGSAVTGAVDAHSTANFLMGDRSGSDRCFNGLIGLLRAYSRAPTLAEFTQHFNRERHWFGV